MKLNHHLVIVYIYVSDKVIVYKSQTKRVPQAKLSLLSLTRMYVVQGNKEV